MSERERHVPLPDGVVISPLPVQAPLRRDPRTPKPDELPSYPLKRRMRELPPKAPLLPRVRKAEPTTEIRHCAVQGLLLGFGIGATVGLLAGSAIAIALAINGT